MTGLLTRIDAALARVPEGFTAGPLRVGILDPESDPVELLRGNLAHGSGYVWAVSAPNHPHASGGWEDKPAHTVTTCVTLNGPASEQNARLYEAAPDIHALLTEARAALVNARREAYKLGYHNGWHAPSDGDYIDEIEYATEPK